MGGNIPGPFPSLYEACLNCKKKQKTIATIHHDDKHDFFFHLVNSATMEMNYEDMNILTIWSIIVDLEIAYTLVIDILSVRLMLRVL